MKRHLPWLILAACGGGGTSAPSPVIPEAPPASSGDPIVAPSPPAPPPAQGHPKDGLIPRAVLYGDPQKSNLMISPDGKWYSWLAPSDGVLNVWVAPAADLAKAHPITTEKTRSIRRYGWAFDNKHVLFQQDQVGNENFHVYAVDVTAATPASVDLFPAKDARVEIAAMSPTKPGVVVLSANDRDPRLMDLHTVDLATGKHALLARNEGFIGFAVDNNLVPRLATKPLPDGSFVEQLYDPARKTWKDFATIPLEDAMTVNTIGFDRRNTAAYAVDSRGRDTAALVRVDLRTKRKTVVFEDAKADVGTVIMHPTRHTPVAALVDYDKPRWVALDKSVQRDLDALAKLDDGVPFFIGGTLDDQTWLILFNSDKQAPHVWRWDRKAQRGTKLFSLRPELDHAGLAPMWPVVVPARDGLSLVSYVTLPNEADANHDGKADHPVPTVMFIHGGPWARDEWGYNTVHQQLANRGYAVISVNYRGSTGFGKKFISAGDLQWGKKMHDDVLDVVQWAIAQGIAPQDKVAILGGSYGGYETLVGLAMTPDVFACGIDLVGPSNLITFQETIPPYWGPFVPLLRARVGDPTTPEGKRLLEQASPLTYASHIRRPLLIGQGKNDPRVNEREASQLVKALQANRIPVSYLLFPDEGHGFGRQENTIAFFAITEAFLSVHLGGWYQPITKDELSASSMQIVAGQDGLPGLPR